MKYSKLYVLCWFCFTDLIVFSFLNLNRFNCLNELLAKQPENLKMEENRLFRRLCPKVKTHNNNKKSSIYNTDICNIVSIIKSIYFIYKNMKISREGGWRQRSRCFVQRTQYIYSEKAFLINLLLSLAIDVGSH